MSGMEAKNRQADVPAVNALCERIALFFEGCGGETKVAEKFGDTPSAVFEGAFADDRSHAYTFFQIVDDRKIRADVLASDIGVEKLNCLSSLIGFWEAWVAWNPHGADTYRTTCDTNPYDEIREHLSYRINDLYKCNVLVHYEPLSDEWWIRSRLRFAYADKTRGKSDELYMGCSLTSFIHSTRLMLISLRLTKQERQRVNTALSEQQRTDILRALDVTKEAIEELRKQFEPQAESLTSDDKVN